jgi:hypothetical protein
MVLQIDEYVAEHEVATVYIALSFCKLIHASPGH